MSKQKKITPQIKKTILRVVLYCFTIGVLLFTVFWLLILSGAFGQIPSKAELKEIKNSIASEVISSDRVMIGRYFYENRTNTHLKNIPKHLIDALVATEDARFYKHKGVDSRSMMRVLVKTILLSNKSAGGGSTITQQLAKNLYQRPDYGIVSMPVAKTKEITIARRMEKVLSKEEILELYLNTVPFGENTFGIETGSLVFFNKKADELSIQESATLIGLLKANHSYNPRLFQDASLRRRNIVLRQMEKYEYLTKKQSDSIQALPLKIDFNPIKHDEGLAPYFREFLRREVNEILENIEKPDGSDYNLYADGLKIYTTLNAKMQKYAEKAVNKHMFRLQKEFDNHWQNKEPWKKDLNYIEKPLKQSDAYRNLKKKGLSEEEIITHLKKNRKTKIFTLSGEQEQEISSLDSILHHFRYLQNGFLVINSHSGEILAWVGGINYKYFKYDHVLSKRQAGSTFKPFVYGTAIENGSTPCDFYGNDSIVYEEYDNWCPENADGKYGGYYSLKGALANSVNTIAVSVLMEQGFNNIIDAAQRAGITSDIPKVPSIALGSAEVSLFEMVYAYTAFANDGKTVEPLYIRRIEDQFGKIIYENSIKQNPEPVFSKYTAETMLAMMQNVIDNGTASSMRTVFGIEGEMAGKTGTTSNNTDSWFIGITPIFIMGSWVGGDNPVVRFRSSYFGQGAYSAMPVCAKFLEQLYTDQFYRSLPRASFNLPSEIYAQLNCDDYKEDYSPIEIEQILDKPVKAIEDLIRNIFGRKKRKNRNTNNEDHTSDSAITN